MSAPSVHLCEGDGQFSYLVVHVENLSNCYVYTIDKKTGGIYYGGVPDLDLFQSAKAAVSYVSDNIGHPKWQYLGKYLIGASIFDQQLVILVVVSDEITAIIDDDPIKMVKRTEYISIPINGAQINQSLQIFEFPLNENHFFSNHIDLSIPFPYTDESKKTTDFFWNNRWTYVFEKLHTPNACIRLFQGAALSMYSDKGNDCNITYIIRRSSLNSGTRYESRGLDKDCNTANECECDLIFTYKGENFGHTWIRGSAPVEWKTVLSSTIGAPQHIVSENSTANTHVYFEKLFKRHSTNSMIIISLLNEAPEKGERDLMNAYIMGVAQSNHIIKGADISFNQIDVNNVISKSKSNGRVEIFKKLKALTDKKVEFTSKTTKQKIYYRFNCADSLDRTNLVSFYYAILVSTKFCLERGIFLRNESEREGTNPEDLTTILSRDALDFICNAFIQTGNIISLIYTNTPAIKTEAIRALMTESTTQSSDLTITLLRRYHNVASDPHRQQVFMQWLEIQRNNSHFYIDSNHLSIAFVPAMVQFPLIETTIFEEEEKKFIISSNKVNPNIFISLPEPLLLCCISILIYPRKSEKMPTLTISCGNNASEMHPFAVDIPIPYFDHQEWCEFDLRKYAKYSTLVPVSALALEPCLFVHLRFNCMNEDLLIGNIKIAVKHPQHKTKAFIDTTIRSQSSKFTNFLQEKTDHPKTLFDFVSIDKFIIDNHISRQTRNDNLVKFQKNPFFYDIPSRFSEAEEGECAYCHLKNDQLKEFGCFQPFLDFYRSFDSKTEKPYKSIFLCPVCSKCLEPIDKKPYFDIDILKKNCTIANEFIERKTVCLDSYQPIFNLGSQSTIFFSSPKATAAELSEILNPKISFQGWHVNQKKADLIISFQSSASITQILLLLEKGISGTLEAFTDHFIQVRTKEISRCGNQVLYSLLNCEPTKCLRIVINGDKDLIIKNIQIRGDIQKMMADMLLPQQASPMKEKFQPFIFEQYDGMFDFTTRTQTFQFQTPQKISQIMFKANNCHTIYIAFIKDGKVVDWQTIIIPNVPQGTILCYKFEYINTSYTEAKIFYLDKTKEITPFDICFNSIN